MKVLQINKYAWPHYGGIERVVNDIQVALNGELDISVFCIDDPLVSEREFRLDKKIIRTKRNFSLFGMPISWEFISKARSIIQSHDVVLLHHPFPLGFLVSRLFGAKKPVIVWYHSDVVRQKFLAKLLSPLFNLVLSSSKSIIVSDLFIANNSSILKNYLSKVVVVPFAQDVYDQVPEKNYNSNKTIEILSVGRLVYYKGYEVLIRAMQGVGANLTIIGDGALKQKLNLLISELGLKNVRIIPAQDSLEDFYKRSDIFVLPSVEISEAFGLVQLEAMAYGLPVINTNLPTAVPTVSINLKTGLTVEPNNVEALKLAIESLVKNPDLRKAYGEAGLVRVNSVYSFNQFKEKLLKVLNETV